MAEMRFFRGWSEAELEERLERAKTLPYNFSDPFERMTVDHGWNQYYSDSIIARERPGPPPENGYFNYAKVSVANYEYSDPRIVVGHFDPTAPLLGRPMLLEIRAFGGLLRYLGSVIVGAVREEEVDGKTVFGFRYDTLEGHIERGTEWFLLTKDHKTGEIRFRVEAAWLPGQFPNWWSRLGFDLIGPRNQKIWHHRAHAALAKLARIPGLSTPEPEEGGLVHTGPVVEFKRLKRSKNVRKEIDVRAGGGDGRDRGTPQHVRPGAPEPPPLP